MSSLAVSRFSLCSFIALLLMCMATFMQSAVARADTPNNPPTMDWNDEPTQDSPTASTVSPNVHINDTESDPVSIAVEYSLDGGSTWTNAGHLSGAAFPISGNTITNIPTYGDGVNNRDNVPFYWDFTDDAPQASTTNAELRITVQDAYATGSVIVSDPFTLKAPPAPPVFADDSGAVSDITENSVIVHYDMASVGSSPLHHFELHYADDAYYTAHGDYAQNTPVTYTASFADSGATDVTGLACATTYHFVQSFTNEDGETATSSDATFTTSDCTGGGGGGDYTFASGDGSSENPYVIDSCEDLVGVNSYLTSDYVLDTDLDCSAAGNFIMIGSGDFSGPFTGDFDGAGHTITIDVENEGESANGLFRFTYGATIHDLAISADSLIVGDDLTGSIVGVAADTTLIRVSSGATVVSVNPSGANYPFAGTGGLVGGLYGGEVDGSEFDGTAISPFIVGGIAGFAFNDLDSGPGALISRSSTNAHISGAFGAGGIAGFVDGGARIRNSYSTGITEYNADLPSMEYGAFGGVAGLVVDGLISRSYAAGTVNAGDHSEAYASGGLVGTMESNDGAVLHSFSTAAVTTGGAPIGGFVGYIDSDNPPSQLYDNYFDTVQSGLSDCNAPGDDFGDVCIGVDGSADGYWLGTDGTPIASWNSSVVWDLSGNDAPLPLLRTYEGPEPDESDDFTTPSRSNGESPVETILDVNHYHGGGTAQGWNADDDHWEYDLPFTFTFYGQTYDRVYVDSNGYLAFSDGGNIDEYNVSVADGIGVPVIFAYGNDLLTNENEGDDIYVTDNGDGQVIFRWQATDIENGDSIADFEIVLKNDNTFEINYGPQTAPINDATAVGVNDGAGSYVASAYDGRTDFDELNTSSWSPPSADEVTPTVIPHKGPARVSHRGSSSTLGFSNVFSPPSGVAGLQSKLSELMAQYQALVAQVGTHPTAGALPTRDITLGAQGADVTALQQFLIAHGFTIPAGATGYFGAQTRAALAAYQKARGIAPAAGYYGPLTRASMSTH
ncbi:MAG TPA: peptidoglycan-binding protein [Candidatus Paceibacterota bacterium]|nr:peptidoglycan-binding protein [Candidatus Paceibacterota bacterium]